MSHETFTPEEYARILNSGKDPVIKKPTIVEKIHTASTKTVEKSIGLLDGLTQLTIVFWYFFFTGLALLFKRKLPTGWLRIATRLERGIISRKIKNTGLKMDLVKEQPQKTHKKYKVVDLETKKPVVLR